MAPNAWCTCVSPNTRAPSTSISWTIIGRRLRSPLPAGNSSRQHRFRFRRPPGLLPLPTPQRGGSIMALQSLLNLDSYDDFILIIAWLLAALRPIGPYPLLALAGEQGSAKTV